jgi:hypothetical protein
MAEAYDEVVKSMNVVGSIAHQPIVNTQLYLDQFFVLAQNTELVSVEGNPSSISTRLSSNHLRIDLEFITNEDPFVRREEDGIVYTRYDYNRSVAQDGYTCLLQTFLHHDISIFVKNNTVEILK